MRKWGNCETQGGVAFVLSVTIHALQRPLYQRRRCLGSYRTGRGELGTSTVRAPGCHTQRLAAYRRTGRPRRAVASTQLAIALCGKVRFRAKMSILHHVANSALYARRPAAERLRDPTAVRGASSTGRRGRQGTATASPGPGVRARGINLGRRVRRRRRIPSSAPRLHGSGRRKRRESKPTPVGAMRN